MDYNINSVVIDIGAFKTCFGDAGDDKPYVLEYLLNSYHFLQILVLN